MAGALAVYIVNESNRFLSVAFFGGMTVLLLFGTGFIMDDMMFSWLFYRIYNLEGMGDGYVAGAEYLPVGTKVGSFT